MHALPQRRTTRLAMLAGAAAMGAALIGGPAKAAEASAPVTTAAATVAATPAAAKPKTKSAAQAKRDRIIALAKKYSGRSYRWGAAGPKSFDCTGFTKFLFQKVGITLPHSGAQAKKGKKVSRTSARPGDLVIFRDSAGRAYHVGVYAGGNKMYDAPTSGEKTGKHRISSRHVEFRRVL